MRRTQHPSNNAVLGAPKGMDIEACDALPITRITYSDGTPAMESWWMPNAIEMQRLLIGLPIKLTILGEYHPPVKLEVSN